MDHQSWLDGDDDGISFFGAAGCWGSWLLGGEKQMGLKKTNWA